MAGLGVGLSSMGLDQTPVARTLVAAVGVTVAATLPSFLLGALSVSIRRDLGIGLASVGLAISVGRGTGALMAGVLGRLADRVGPSRSLRAAAGIATGSALGIAALADNWWLVLVVVALGGAAAPLAQASANLSLSVGVGLRRQGIAFGVKQSGLPISSVLAGLAVPSIALTLGWRWAFVIAACFSVVIGLLVPPIGGRPLSAPGTRRALGPPPTKIASFPLVVLASGLFFSATASAALSVFTVEAAVSVGIAEGWAGVILMAGSLLAVGARLGLGVLADRKNREHLLVVAGMVAVSTLGYLVLSLDSLGAFLVGGFIAFAFGWGYAGLFWYAVVRIGFAAPGRATGWVLPGGMIGAMSGPLLFGWIADTGGTRAAWIVMGVLSAVSAGIIYWGWRLVAAIVSDGPTASIESPQSAT